jgi:hypothetical protein
MNYAQFRSVAVQLPSKYRTFFKPSLFLAFSRPSRLDADAERRLPIEPFFNYVLRRGKLDVVSVLPSF